MIYIAMEKNFIKIRTKKDTFIFTSFIVVGIAAIVMPTGPAVNIAAALLVLLGLVMAPLMKSGYREELSGKEYLKKEYLFPQTMKQDLLSAVMFRPQALDFSEKDKGTNLRVDVYYSKSVGKVYMQLLEYIPHQYTPCTKMMEYNINSEGKLI